MLFAFSLTRAARLALGKELGLAENIALYALTLYASVSLQRSKNHRTFTTVSNNTDAKGYLRVYLS